MMPHLILLKNLMHASTKVWQLVKFKDTYGKGFFIMGSRGVIPYEKALAKAMTDLEQSLQEASIVHVWAEGVN